MEKRLFNDNWLFSKTKIGGKLNECNWNEVEIPHDFLIHNTNDLYESCIGWYKKDFEVKDFDKSKESFFINFDGVYMDCTIFLNDEFVGEWKYGYTAFELDLSEHIKEKNTIIVKVVHQEPNSRWYSGAGIFRNIHIKRKNKKHIVSNSIYVNAENIESDKWILKADLVLSEACENEKVVFEIYAKEQLILTHNTKGGSSIKEEIEVLNPKLWSLETSENIYTLKVNIYNEETDSIIDFDCVNFGFRTIVMDVENGLSINGKKIMLNGVCQHHDLGGLGSAFNKKALERQLVILKEMGVNAIRTSHNPPAKELMDLADEMGILICSEALDMWEGVKTTYDYSRFFNEWVDRDFKSWIERDRNHPSLIMWSIGNEIQDTHNSLRGLEITEMLYDIVKKYDYYGNAPTTIGSNYMPWENAQKCADVIKVAGYNYAERLYEEHHKKYPDWFIYGSETSSVVQSRGVYHFPFSKSILADDDEQCSSLGNSITSWGSKSMEKCIINHRNKPFVMGQFLWTGTDYIGEPTPYSTKNSYFGQIDTAGFPKDAFYFYQAEWTSYKINPMVHIFPHWDFSKGQLIDVRVCSNAPTIELYLNDKLIDKKNIDHEFGEELIPTFKIPYEEGILKAIAYDENNVIIAIDEQKSFKDAKEIKVKISDEKIFADGKDLSFIEIYVVDENGNEVKNANNRIDVEVSGCGRLVALDNGDSTDFEQYKCTSRRMFSGKLLAMVAPTYTAGKIEVIIKSKGFENKIVQIESLDCEIEEGHTTYLFENIKSQENSEIPVRKIELELERNLLDEKNNTTLVTAKIYPENATHKNLEWRLTNDVGVDSVAVKYEVVNDNQILIEGIGNGEVFVRCATKNGGEKIKLYSQMELKVDGLGDNFFNPYTYVSAPLYSYCNRELSTGLQRGISTLTVEDTHISYENIDFGNFGSTEIIVDVFSLNNDNFYIDVWDGNPDLDKNPEKIVTVEYTLGNIWNTYQEVFFKLPNRIKGFKTITFTFRNGVHIKGFRAIEEEKAYSKLFVSKDKDSIYGDSFKLKEDYIEKIGNNVSIAFNDMNFEKGVSKIEICGRTPLESNTIQIRFTKGDDVRIEEVAFTKSEDFKILNFDLEVTSGLTNVEFLFLPGSNFDFEWFKFS